eukprot:354078_1
MASSSILSQFMDNAVPSSTLTHKSDSVKQSRPSCYYGDCKDTTSLEYYYGHDVPRAPHICPNGLFSYGDQTQMHRLSILYKYPFMHPLSIVYSLLFLWCIQFHLNPFTFIILLLIHLSTAEALKVERHDALRTNLDLLHIVAQFIGDILLIPYQCIYGTEYPLIQFQDTCINRNIFSQCKSMVQFSPTFWCRNYIKQFLLVVWEEQYLPYTHFKIYRETLMTDDGGLIALDYWIDPSTHQPKNNTTVQE